MPIRQTDPVLPATDNQPTVEDLKVQIERLKLDLEKESLRLEQSKRNWAIVTGLAVPLVAGIVSAIYSYASIGNGPKVEFLKLLAQHPDKSDPVRSQIVEDWHTMWNGESWIKEYKKL